MLWMLLPLQKTFAVFEEVSKELTDKCHTFTKDIVITAENMLPVATISKNPLFEEISEVLNAKCHIFLKINLTTANAVFDFFLKTKEECSQEDMDLIYKILKTKPASRWTTLYSLPEERQIMSGYGGPFKSPVATIPKLPKQWRITHNFKPTIYTSSWFDAPLMQGSGLAVFLLTLHDNNHGTSNYNNYLNGSKWSHFPNHRPAMGEWTAMEVSHQLEAGQYIFRILIGGVEVVKEVNTRPMEVTDVAVYTTDARGNPSPPQPGVIKDIIIECID